MTTRVAIVGCGRVVKDAYVDALRSIDELQLCAVVDLDEQRASDIAEALCGTGSRADVYTDVSVLSPTDVDLVLVALPPAPAVRATRVLLERGCNVLAEKPLSLDVGVLSELAGAATRTGAWFGLVTNYLHRPDLALAISIVSDGIIGRPAWVRLHMPDTGHWPGVQGYDPDWRIRPHELASGVAGDKGFHLLYLAEALAGSPIRDCQWRALGQPSGHVETWSAQAGHENGVASSLLVTWAAHGHASSLLEIHGSEGSLYVDPTMREPVELAMRDGTTRLVKFDHTDAWGYGAQFTYAAAGALHHRASDLSGPKRWAKILGEVEARRPLPSFGTTILEQAQRDH